MHKLTIAASNAKDFHVTVHERFEMGFDELLPLRKKPSDLFSPVLLNSLDSRNKVLIHESSHYDKLLETFKAGEAPSRELLNGFFQSAVRTNLRYEVEVNHQFVRRLQYELPEFTIVMQKKHFVNDSGTYDTFGNSLCDVSLYHNKPLHTTVLPMFGHIMMNVTKVQVAAMAGELKKSTAFSEPQLLAGMLHTASNLTMVYLKQGCIVRHVKVFGIGLTVEERNTKVYQLDLDLDREITTLSVSDEVDCWEALARIVTFLKNEK